MSYNLRLVNIFGVPFVPGLLGILEVFVEYLNVRIRLVEKVILAYYYTLLLIWVIRLIRYMKKHPEGLFNIEDTRG